MGKTKYKIHLNYEDCIRVTGMKDGLMIYDERISDVDEQRSTLKEFAELVAQDESDKLMMMLGSLFENFEMKSMEIEIWLKRW